MRRAVPVLRALHQAAAGAEATQAAAAGSARHASSLTFASLSDAPPAPVGGPVQVRVKEVKGKVDVSVVAGDATARASYSLGSARGAPSLALYDTPRISVLHASFMQHLLQLAHERYQILAQWPDFTKMYGKDYYYRAHPEELRKFYALVDEFHRMWDVVTEFDSLGQLASDMVPAYRRKRLSTVHPAAGPAVANGVVTQFLLAGAK